MGIVRTHLQDETHVLFDLAKGVAVAVLTSITGFNLASLRAIKQFR
jgi:hypothetical protein